MQDDDINFQPDAASEPESPSDEDARWQRVVLELLLDEQPNPLTQEEISRELVGGDADFLDQDGLKRAIRDLESVDLVCRSGVLVTLTRAARRMDELGLA